MNTGPENVTTTTTSEPPAFLQPALQNALDMSNEQISQHRNIPTQFNMEEGLTAAQLTPNARGLVNSTLRGDFLSPDSNPFLESTFNRAADLTRTRLDSEFSGAGRNLGAARPARSEELQTLASNIFGQNFQAERDRQVGAVAQAESLDPLNQYLNRIAAIIPGAGGVTTSNQPVFRTGLF